MKKFQEKLNIILLNRRMTAKELCHKIDMTRANLNLIYKRNSIDTKWLEKMSDVLDVPMAYWFENEENSRNIIINGSNLVNGNNNNVQSNLKNCQLELDNALKRIKELEGIISMKDVLIEQMLRASKK